MAEPIPNPSPDPSTPPSQPARPRKKRRVFLKVVLGIIFVLILLILFAPAIISTSMVRSAVVGQVNKNLNGRIEVADWSVGWSGGIDARGFKIFDDAGVQIAQLDHFSTQLPLTKAIFGKLPLGKVIVDGLSFTARVDQDGQLNFARLAKKGSQPTDSSSSPAQSTNSSPSKLPDISGDIEISNAHGTIEQAGKPTVNITQVGGSIKIPDINQAITDDLTMAIKVGDAPEGKITASGSANVIQNNQVSLGKGNLSQALDVQGVDLHALLPFIPPSAGIDNIAGITTAHVSLDLKGGNAATVDIAVNSAGIVATGPALKGDTFASKVFTIMVPKLSADFPDGADKWQTGRIKVGADAGSQPILVQFDQGAITAVADVVPQAILNLAANQKPGATGRLWMGTNIDVGQLARQLKNTIHISNDVTVTGGSGKQTLNITMAQDRATINAVADITGIAGQRAGKPISLQPIHLSFDSADQGGGGKLPDLRDLKIILQSSFATADFHGASLADLSGSLKGQLQTLQAELNQFIDFGGRQLTGDFNITLNNQGDLTTPGGTDKASAQATLSNLKVGDDINQSWLQANFSADLHHGESAFVDSAKNIAISVQTNNPQSPTVDLYATADVDLSTATKANFKLERANVDFPRFQAEFGKLIPSGIILAGGNFSASASGKYDGAAQSISVQNLVVAANHATIQRQQPGAATSNLLEDDTFTITAPAIDVASSSIATSINLPKFTVADSQQIISADVTDAQAQLAKTGSPAIHVFDMLQKASVALNVPDLKRAKALADAFGSPSNASLTDPKSASASSSTAAPLPPLMMNSGSFAAHVDLSHNGSALVLNIPAIIGQNIAFHRGNVSYSMKPFEVKLNASIETADGKSAMEQIRKVQVTQLTGNLGVATLSMPTPITITDPASTTPIAQGAVKIDGRIQDITQLIEALQAKNPGEIYPYRGDLSLTENIGSQNGGVNLGGGIQVGHFQVIRGGDVAFTEDQLSVGNDVSLASDFNSVMIRNLSVNMQSSAAVNLIVQNGTIADLKQARQIHLAADLQYDLAKLWPIVHPMLIKPGQEDQYKDLKIDGQFKKTFTVNGSYPAGVPFSQAIRSIAADGAIAVGSLDYNGLNVQKLDLPVSLRDGKATTVYGDKPAGQNAPAIAIANEGQLDIGNITVDLTQDPPRVSSPPNKAVLTHATINPLFARTFLAKVINNPVFVGANSASGLLDLKIVQCEQVPLGNLLLQPTPENTGHATLQFSLTNLHVGGEGMGKVLGQLFHGNASDSFEANVKDATVSIAGGVATQHLNFQTGKYNLGFDGSVGLLNKDLRPLSVNVPIARIVQTIRNDPNILKYVPDQAMVMMTGTLSDPKLHLDQLISKVLAEAGAKALVGGVLPGANKPDPPVPGGAAPTQPTAQPDNPIGDLLNGLEKKQQQKDQQKQEEQKKKTQPKPKPKRTDLPP